MFGMEIDEGPIAFVAFGHEPLALLFPIRIRAQNGDLRTDIMGGSLTPDPQDVRGKRGGRRLAMRPRDNDALFPEHDRGECLGPSEERDATLHRLIVGGIARLDRARVDHDVGADDRLGGMRTGKAETRLLEALRLARSHLVRSRNVVPEAQEERGEPAHARAGHTDEVDTDRFVPLGESFAPDFAKIAHRNRFTSSFPRPPHRRAPRRREWRGLSQRPAFSQAAHHQKSTRGFSPQNLLR